MRAPNNVGVLLMTTVVSPISQTGLCERENVGFLEVASVSPEFLLILDISRPEISRVMIDNLNLRSLNIPSELILADHLQNNPFHPFKQIHLGKLEYSSRYNAFYVSILGLGSSILAAIIFILVGIFDGHSLRSPIFPMPFFFIAISIAGLVNFYDVKILALFPVSNEYSFSYGSKEHIRADKHNIYVRLRRDHRSGKTYSCSLY